MSKKRNDGFSEAIVGLFMLAVLALLVYFTIVISGVDVLQGRTKVNAAVTFTDVGGLKDHDSVMYRGTKVGAVDRIDISPTNLVVHIEIDKSVVLRESYRIAICNLSMLGGNYLLLEEGKGDVLPLETTAFVGETPTDWMRDVAEIARNLKTFTSDGQLHTIITNVSVATANISAASEDVKTVVARVERGEGTIGKLVSTNDTLYADAQKMVANMSVASEDLKAIVARVERGEGTVGKLLSTNDTVYVNLDAAIGDFRKACASMDFAETKASANKLLENLNAVSEKLKSGEGSLGKLVNDPELYDEVQGLTKDVRQVIDNFRDTTPISTFGSLIMGGL